MKYKIKSSPEMGRGLYPLKTISKGETIAVCEILLLSQDDTVKVNDTDLKFYTFKFDETRDCLVLGDGEIFNHADDSNVSYELVSYDENFQTRYRMFFVAKRDIGVSEQLLINYSDDIQVDSKQYISQQSLF